MQISILDDAGPTATVALQGRLDFKGVEVVAPPLATLSASKRGLVIDMSGVTFIAGVGVRQLLTASLELMRRGQARLVLLRPAELVLDILAAAGITDLMTIVHNEREAATAVASIRG